MCFSAEASFAVGAALVPAGIYCLKSAFQKRTALVPLALCAAGGALLLIGAAVSNTRQFAAPEDSIVTVFLAVALTSQR